MIIMTCTLLRTVAYYGSGILRQAKGIVAFNHGSVSHIRLIGNTPAQLHKMHQAQKTRKHGTHAPIFYFMHTLHDRWKSSVHGGIVLLE
jgi:hypothetical protein